MKQSRETILFALCGRSPAVLTETVWSLSRETPPVIPDKVQVITTTAGKSCLEKQLFSCSYSPQGINPWETLLKELALDHPIADKLQWEPVLIATDREGSPLEDLTKQKESEALADFLLAQLRPYTLQENLTIIGSLAGGRKTMSALLYACFTLLARPHDRLTHVLVNSPFDLPLNPPFYFPPRQANLHHLTDRSGQIVSTHSSDDACIQLADIPFVSLRHLAAHAHNFRQVPKGFTSLVQTVQAQALAHTKPAPQLSIELAPSTAKIHCEGQEIKIKGQQLLLFLHLAESCKNGVVFADHSECFASLIKFAARLEAAEGKIPSYLKEASSTLLDKDAKSAKRHFIRNQLSHLRNKLTNQGPLQVHRGRLCPFPNTPPNIEIDYLGTIPPDIL